MKLGVRLEAKVSLDAEAEAILAALPAEELNKRLLDLSNTLRDGLKCELKHRTDERINAEIKSIVWIE